MTVVYPPWPHRSPLHVCPGCNRISSLTLISYSTWDKSLNPSKLQIGISKVVITTPYQDAMKIGYLYSTYLSVPSSSVLP